MNIQFVDAKQILVRNKSPENWFGVHFNINVYRGCQHDCIYCDSRSDCYQIESFGDLIVKRNADILLEKTLRSRKRKVTIGTGSMSDPYIPAEKHIRLTQKILSVIKDCEYPLHIVTKSDMIMRDIDILREINKVFLSVCFTITTVSEGLAQKIEPRAPSPLRRLQAIELLSSHGIYCGVLYQPILPYLTDTQENIHDTVKQVADAGGKFIIPWFAVTTRKGQREYFFEKLAEISPEVARQYREKFSDLYVCNCPRAKELYRYFEEICREYNICYKMSEIQNFQKLNPYKQMDIFDYMGNDATTT
jgi:DNA repair photolyase